MSCPTLLMGPPCGGGGGAGRLNLCNWCCCCCCSCLNLNYVTTQHGLIKLAEAMLGGLCQNLLVKYGMPEASSLGPAFYGFLTTASACLLTTALLIACYVLSSNTQNLIRQSIFECLFNSVACFLYLSASSYMWYAVVSVITTNPAMTVVSCVGVVLGILHGVDAIISYRR